MMFFRRVLYFLFLSGAFLYYVFHTGYLSWVLFVVVIALPFLSLLLTLLFRRQCRVAVRCDSGPESGLTASLRIEPALPYTSVRVRVLFENLFSGESAGENVVLNRRDCPGNKINLRYESNLCGVVRFSVTAAHLTDLLGLFYLPIRAPEPVGTLLLPAELPFSGDNIEWPAAEHEQDEKPAGIIGEREYRDIRPYREGDSLRDIHWKLTARFDRPIVREYDFSAASVKTAAIRWAGECEELCRALGRLLGVIRYFSGHGQYLLLFLDETMRELVSPNAEALHALLWNALSKPPSETKNTETLPDGILLVEPGGILLCENGAQKEVAPA